MTTSEVSQTTKTRTNSYKLYKCTKCGYEKDINTNHYGKCWSFGHHNVCQECPPYAKYPEFGGQTVWKCMETPEEKED